MFNSTKINKNQFIYSQTQIKKENRIYKNLLSSKSYKLAQIYNNNKNNEKFAI